MKQEAGAADDSAQEIFVKFDDGTLAAAAHAFEPKPSPLRRQASLWVSAFAVGVSLISTGVAIQNNHSSERAHSQDQLLTLVQDLTQVPAQVAALRETYKDDPTSYRQLGGEAATSEEIEAQEAAQLIHGLHEDVPAPELLQVGVSLGASGEYARAITLLSVAASRAQDPSTRASSYREWARELYVLGRPRAARREVGYAQAAYPTTGEPTSSVAQNHIFTTLFQIPFEIPLHRCTYARTQFKRVVAMIKTLPASSASFSQDTTEAKEEQVAIHACK